MDFPDEEEDDFNPQPEIGSDDEGDAKPRAEPVDDGPDLKEDAADDAKPAGEDDDDDEEGDASGEAGADEDEEGGGGEQDEDEEEEDEDEDDDIEGQPSRKRRKRRRNQFIDVEAEVDEDDEEEPEEEDDLPGEEMHPDDLQELPPGADRDDRMHRELDRQRERQEAMDVEETAARLKERYGRKQGAGGAGSAIVPQRLLLPGVNDPRIWRMKCRPGKEREIVHAINKRISDRLRSREPVQIFSAFERGGPMAGNLYVEAARQDDIPPALDGISHIFLGTKPLLIPLEEMPDLLRTKKSKELEPGMYVRPKRGLYAGDLAIIDEVEANGTEVTLRLVPRLDYGLSEDTSMMEPDGQGGMKRKRAVRPLGQRPPARLFSETEARKKHQKYLNSGGGLSKNTWLYQNKTYVDGFLVDTFRINALDTENVNPTLEEVTRFAAGAEDGTENLDLNALAATLKTSAGADYLPGDQVEIFRGEQKGLIGRAKEVYGDVVKMKIDQGPLAGKTVEVPTRDLRKLFREGDHVKVIGGSKYQDEVGMVVRIKDDRVTILTDSNQQEISVFSKDLREATDSGGTVGVSKYDLFDLVQLDAATVGCVVKVDRESLKVMDQIGSVRTLLPSNIPSKVEKPRHGASTSTDRLNNEIHEQDVIKEYGGEGKTGPVLHVHRGYVFARSLEIRDNAGVFVARANNVELASAKGGRVGPDITKMNTTLKPNGGGAMPMPPPQQKGRDRLIGRSVKIRAGALKSMIGIVKDSTDSTAIIELHAKNKKVTIEKSKLAVIDPKTATVINPDASTFNGGRSGPPGRAPMMGGQTPGRGFGGPPPGAGSARTPAYAQGGRTPTWKQDGGRTPAYVGGGGQTAYGGGGFGGSTSYGGQTSYGGATSYGGGSVWGGAGGGGGGGVSTHLSISA